MSVTGSMLGADFPCQAHGVLRVVAGWQLAGCAERLKDSSVDAQTEQKVRISGRVWLDDVRHT